MTAPQFVDVAMFEDGSPFSGEVHPFAALFPMLPADQLQDLADDIKANGQLNPILLDREGRLVDGRNRLAACAMVNVPPVFDTVDADPVSVVVSANAKRRHMTAGQRVMAVALGMWEHGMWDADAGQWKRGNRKFADAKLTATDLALAGTILAFSRELSIEVLNGDRSLRATYDKVKTLQSESVEHARKRAELEANAPEVLSKIDDDFTFDMAWVAYQERDRERIAEQTRAEESRRNAIESLWIAVRTLAGHLASPERREFFASLDLATVAEPITQDQMEDAEAVLNLMRNRA